MSSAFPYTPLAPTTTLTHVYLSNGRLPSTPLPLTTPHCTKVLFTAALEAYMSLTGGKPPPYPPECRSPNRPWWGPHGKP